MDINNLTSGERETLMYEVLMVLRTSIPNVTRPSSILINQNQPMTVDDKGSYFDVTAYVRAVDFSGKYLFLGPYFFKANRKGTGWEVSDPHFDCGIDGCFYDIVGFEGSHMKVYNNMVTIDERPVYFAECEGATLREPTENDPGVMIYHMKDGSFIPFYWDNTTQNTTFMERLLEISDLMITTAGKEADAKAAKEAAAAARAAARPAFARQQLAPAKQEAPAAEAPKEAPQKDAFARPAAKSPFSSKTMDDMFIKDEAPETVERPHAFGKTLASTRAAEPEEPAKPAEAPAASPFTRPAARPAAPEPEKEPEKKSPFVPLKNVTPEMEKPKPFDGPGITDAYVPEWSKPQQPAATDDKEPEIKPMTAESLSHLDDWKPYKSRVVIAPEEEVEKYRRLLSIGAITQEEFNLKKKKLLGE